MSERTSYLNRLFSTRDGYVAVACKRGENSWDERVYAWPSERAQLLGWVGQQAPQANVFICPSLRATKSRAKADMADGECGWLWADVDWAKIKSPRARRSVKLRIEQLGTYVVRSGTGRNVHVYVKLKTPVNADDHLRLNTGLRDYLYADHKQADNSLLRLPGTTNRKPEHGETGAPVTEAGGHGKRFSVDQLMGLPTFARVMKKVAIEASDEWERVTVPRLRGRIRQAVKMDVEEATDRYGSRHGAVWAVTGDLIKQGFTPDQIHTIMDSFPAGVDKQDTERGYSLHKDVARRIARYDAAPELAREAIEKGQVDDDDESPFEDLTDEELMALPSESALVRKELERRDVKRQADRIEAERSFIAPDDSTSFSLSDALLSPPQPEPKLIEKLLGIRHNVVLTAQYKTGKTTFLTGSFIKALADGEPFLGQFTTPPDGTVCGHWNLEMDDAELLDDYLRPAAISNTDRVHWWGGQGRRLNILTAQGKAWAVEWLRSRAIKVWTVDSWSRLAFMCGINENDGTEVLRVLATIDEIKREAGVDVCLLIAHTGRGENAQDRPKGAVELDAWTDARWLMSKDADGDTRFLTVNGRGVSLVTTALNYNETTRAYTLGSGGRAEVAARGAVQSVVAIVMANEGITKTSLVTRVKRELRLKNDSDARELIAETVDCGWVRTEKKPGGSGGRLVHKFYVVGTRPKAGGATPRVVDFTRVGNRPRRG